MPSTSRPRSSSAQIPIAFPSSTSTPRIRASLSRFLLIFLLSITFVAFFKYFLVLNCAIEYILSPVFLIFVYQSFVGHGHNIPCVAVSPDDTLIASASIDNTVRLWNPFTKAEVAKIKLTEWCFLISSSTIVLAALLFCHLGMKSPSYYDETF